MEKFRVKEKGVGICSINGCVKVYPNGTTKPLYQWELDNEKNKLRNLSARGTRLRNRGR